MKELQFSFLFTLSIYLLCTSLYQSTKLSNNKNNTTYFQLVDYPVSNRCQLESDFFYKKKEINYLISQAREQKVNLNRLKQILPKPKKTACASPVDIRKKNSEVMQIPNYTFTKQDIIIIAVIDTGIDLDNPHLSKQVFLPKMLKSINDLDFSKDKNIQDTNGHGSHVAGLILSVFPEAKILPIKYHSSHASGKENLTASIAALKYAIDQKVTVINYSGGGPDSDEAELAILKEAEEKGIIVVSSAGNNKSNLDLSPFYPASYNLSNIISVGNIDERGIKAAYSNFSKNQVDLFAPGEKISSYWISGENCLNKQSGTSMSAPLVSATVALLKNQNPKLNHKQIKSLILSTVSMSQELSQFSKSGGKLDINRSISAISYEYKTK